MGLTERSFLERMELMGLTESRKEYVKIEVGTFYRFVELLKLIVSLSDIRGTDAEYLMERIKDFEYEVLHDGEPRDET